MNFMEYQSKARMTAIYPGKFELMGLMYVCLGLCGETGEFAEKIKKMIRDDNGVMTKERQDLIMKELGDVLWYIANICSELKISMNDVAYMNLEKLYNRKVEDKLHGDGDNR